MYLLIYIHVQIRTQIHLEVYSCASNEKVPEVREMRDEDPLHWRKIIFLKSGLRVLRISQRVTSCEN